jgi:hypothetical protein
LVIRNDVEQGSANRLVTLRLYKKHEPTEADLACGGYMAWQVNSISRAAGLPDSKAYGDIHEWLKDMAGKPMKVFIKHEAYNGRNYIKVSEFSPTAFAEVKHKKAERKTLAQREAQKQPQSRDGQDVDFLRGIADPVFGSDDDIPF